MLRILLFVKLRDCHPIDFLLHKFYMSYKYLKQAIMSGLNFTSKIIKD